MGKTNQATVVLNNDTEIKVNIVRKNSPNKKDYITDNDREMDRRAKAAVKNAIEKAKICGKPITVYDKKSGQVAIIYADGSKEIIK